MAHFTESQIEEIRRRLSKKAVKDSELPETDALGSEDFVAIVQNGTNKRISADTFREELQNGPQGEPGKSAYEIAVQHGFEGTEEEWIVKYINELPTYHLTWSQYQAKRDATELDPKTWYMVYSDNMTSRLLKIYIGYTLFAERSDEGDTGFPYSFPIVF